MKIPSTNSVLRLFSFSWLTGPLFDKELRISSRRRRNYVLRFAYIMLLTLFIVIVWLRIVQFQGAATFQKARMSAAGKTVITTIVTFQFFATQLIAIIMLSNSISDEISHFGRFDDNSHQQLPDCHGKALQQAVADYPAISY